MADFLQKSAISAVLLAEVIQYLKVLNNSIEAAGQARLVQARLVFQN
jgi:hypothetical protein